MIKECARGFLDQEGIDEYQFSGKHPFYQQVHDRIYRPLVNAGLMVENENNTFTIPPGSRFRNVCGKQLRDNPTSCWMICGKTSSPRLRNACSVKSGCQNCYENLNAVDGVDKSLLDNYRRMLYKECLRNSSYL